ncbi:CDP-alcohol phosphatidyltransferase family protein [Thermoactinospora rubra]|uniref:CDP-alcohol phosphatidyltransferase family protein n=1 Tax=Thermoactinospora rubra TaxID=1088767 RepID=UPI001F0B5254|nr:CDP-alcohol phosphatidyltransferase family protein [Thermoactinospora rubra]
MADAGMRGYTLEQVRAQTYKARDAWWTVLLVDPLAGRLVVFLANRTAVTPNQITGAAFCVGLGSAACFLMGGWTWLAAGAVLYHLSFVLDCLDGKIARLKGTGTLLGGWLDYVLDRIRVLACALALMWGQFRATGEELYLVLGIVVVFLDMLRYVDALQVAKVRRQMRRRLAEAIADAGEPDTGEPEAGEPGAVPTAALQQHVHRHLAWYVPIRDWLRDRRIRPHLVSGIEFQMAVFIVGPLTGLIAPVTIGTAVLLLAFEAAIMFKLWLSFRDLDAELARIRSRATLAGRLTAPHARG